MKIIVVLLALALTGCASSKVFLGGYTKAGYTDKQLSVDRNTCSKESMQLFYDTPARGQVASYFAQRHMFECMKKKGYESTDVHPDAYKQTL